VTSWRVTSYQATEEDVQREALDHLRRSIEQMPRCNLMVGGRSGVGKSTLLNAVFGAEVAAVGHLRRETQTIDAYAVPNSRLTIVDTPGAELGKDLDETVGMYVGEIERRARLGPEDYVHVFWYCVHANNRRLQEFEKGLIKAAGARVPVVVVMTQTLDLQEPMTVDFSSTSARRSFPSSGPSRFSP
jgi:predicted GTPase